MASFVAVVVSIGISNKLVGSCVDVHVLLVVCTWDKAKMEEDCDRVPDCAVSV